MSKYSLYHSARTNPWCLIFPSSSRGTYLFLALVLLVTFQPALAFTQTTCNPYEVRVDTTPAPPQWPPIYERFDAMMAKFPERADLVVFGDSLAAGWQDKLFSLLFPGQTVGNGGVGGAVTQNSLWQLEEMPVDKIKPSKVMVILGTNNLKGGSACAIVAGLDAVIAKIHAVWPGALIYMFDIPPRGEVFGEYEDIRISVNLGMKKLKEKYTFLTVIGGFDDELTCNQRGISALQYWLPSLFPDECINYQKDNVHLTESGYTILMGALRKELN